MPEMVEIYRVRRKDIESIVQLAELCQLAHWPPEDYVAELERKDSIFLAARSDSPKIDGFILGRVITGGSEASANAEIYNLGVSPRLRSRGIGRSLIHEFIAKAVRRGASRVFLEVRNSNTGAIAFYEKTGLEKLSVRPSFYRDPVEDAVLMSAEINKIRTNADK
jgi:ribosomal-protein-alanine N-acetyltransferase